MACAIIWVASVWTLNQVMMGVRWVEIVSNQSAITVRATGLLTIAVLSFDVLIEISAAYIAFYALPVLVRKVGHVPIPNTHKGNSKGLTDAYKN